MSNILRFPTPAGWVQAGELINAVIKETTPQFTEAELATARHVEAFQAVQEALPDEYGNYDPDCDCRDCQPRPAYDVSGFPDDDEPDGGDMHICPDTPAEYVGACPDCTPRVVTVEKGYDPDYNPMWDVKVNGEIVAQVLVWETADTTKYPDGSVDSRAVAYHLAEAMRSYDGPLEEPR